MSGTVRVKAKIEKRVRDEVDKRSLVAREERLLMQAGWTDITLVVEPEEEAVEHDEQ